MSTDVYFDFHSPTTHPHYKAWEDASRQPYTPDTDSEARWALHAAWCQSTKGNGGYDDCRVAYLYNLVKEVNSDLWIKFKERWDTGVVITEENIPEIVADWKVLYDNSQMPGDDFMQDDICSVEGMEDMLREHLGFHMYTRVD